MQDIWYFGLLNPENFSKMYVRASQRQKPANRLNPLRNVLTGVKQGKMNSQSFHRKQLTQNYLKGDTVSIHHN